MFSYIVESKFSVIFIHWLPKVFIYISEIQFWNFHEQWIYSCLLIEVKQTLRIHDNSISYDDVLYIFGTRIILGQFSIIHIWFYHETYIVFVVVVIATTLYVVESSRKFLTICCTMNINRNLSFFIYSPRTLTARLELQVYLKSIFASAHSISDRIMLISRYEIKIRLHLRRDSNPRPLD